MVTHRNVLIIDSLEGVMDEAASLVRELGHRTYRNASAVGVGTALAEHDIGVIIIGWDRPLRDSDKLTTLVHSWRRLRQVAIVIIAARSARDLAESFDPVTGVAVVEAERMDTELPSLLGQNLRDAVAAASLRPEGSQFVHRLEQRLRSAAAAWEAVAQGAPRHRDVEFVVSAAHGQATTLAFVRLSLLLVEVLEVLRRAESRGRVTSEQYNAVAAALRFAVQVSIAPPYDADCDVSALVARLKACRD